MNTPTSKNLLPIEEAGNRKLYRIKKFYINYYHHNVTQNMWVPPENLEFKILPNIYMILNDSVGVELSVEIHDPVKVDDPPLCTFKTRTEFDWSALITEQQEKKIVVKFTEEHSEILIQLAISSSRGALSLISEGLFLLPLMEAKNFISPPSSSTAI